MKKYGLIVVDPPWEIKKITIKIRPNQKTMDYNMMSIDDIKSLPIESISDDKSWLFLWTTQKYLFESKSVLEHWGFKYFAMGVWEKTFGKSAGMPLFGFRYNAEFILIGHKHKPEIFPKQKLIPLAFSAENVKHSQKPNKFYKMIEHLSPNRADIFARQEREGWDVWGNEVYSTVELKKDGQLLLSNDNKIQNKSKKNFFN